MSAKGRPDVSAKERADMSARERTDLSVRWDGRQTCHQERERENRADLSARGESRAYQQEGIVDLSVVEGLSAKGGGRTCQQRDSRAVRERVCQHISRKGRGKGSVVRDERERSSVRGKAGL